MIKVRATRDGHYGGYYRYGPVDSDQGYQPGEIFEVDEKPFPVTDEQGKPVQEMEPTGGIDEKGNKLFKLAWMTENGKVKKDASGQPIPNIRMTSYFSPTWMERVSDDEEVTFDYPPFALPSAYKVKKAKGVKTVSLPTEVTSAANGTGPGVESVI